MPALRHFVVCKVAGAEAASATVAIKVGNKSRNRRIDTPINR